MAWIALAVMACTDNENGGDDDSGDTDDLPDPGFDATVEAADVAGVAFVTITADEAGTGWVSTPTGGDTPQVAIGPGSAEITVYGLRAGEEVVVTAHFVGATLDGVLDLTVTTPPPPTSAPAFTLSQQVTDEACDPGGYVLFSYLGDNATGVGIVDRQGRYVWGADSSLSTENTWSAGKTVQLTRVRPSRDGQSVLWTYNDPVRVDDYSGIVRLSLDGRTRVDTRTVGAHHDFVELPDGRLGWLAYEFETVPKSEVEGAPAEAPDPMYVAMDAIYEADEGHASETGHQIVWSMFESGYPLYWSGNEMRCVGEFLPDTCEFSHGNSLMFRDSDEAYFAMFRWTDALVKVDRATGALLWQMGGRDTENDFVVDEEDAFTHAHMSELFDGGMMVYDNRIEDELPPGEGSRLLEYSLDETALTCDVVWEHISDRHDDLLGDVRRMPVAGCDNVIVAWSQQGRIVEMTREGTEVWELSTPIGLVVSRVFYLPSLYDMSTGLAP